MRTEFIEEPELEFGSGRHIDICFGLMNYGPLDSESAIAPKRIRLGIVGTTETVEGLAGWIEKCRNGISAKQSNQPNLFVRFPGFPRSALGKAIRGRDSLCAAHGIN